MTTLPEESPAPPPPGFPGRGWTVLLRRLGPLLGLALVFLLFTVLRPGTFPTTGNVQIMLLQTAVVGTAALGMTLIIIAGGIDLSVGSTIALASVLVALLLRAGLPPALAALAGVCGGAAVGAVNGLLITGLRLPPFIVTLGTLSAMRGAAKGIAQNQTVVPRAATWLNDLLVQSAGFTYPAWMPAGGGGRLLRLAWEMPAGVWATVVLAVVVAGALRYTKFGRHVFAVGSNEDTARLCGVNVPLNKLLVYTLAGALAGLAGVLHFSYLTIGDPTSAAGYELNVIAAVVIGGASLSGGEGTILGSLIGALIMTAVSNGCTKLGFDNWVQEIVTGGIIILAVALDRLRHGRG